MNIHLKIVSASRLILILILLFITTESYSQYRHKTVRDTTKYSEKNIDVKIFRTFNNIHSRFVHSMITVTNESIVPVSIAAPIGMYVAARINKNHYDESSAVLLALSEITNEAATQIIKKVVKRDRPFRTLNGVYISDTTSLQGTYSFPSGHSSGSFVLATSLTLRYPDKPVLIAGLYTYATLVSLGRMYWGVHYPSDVFTGMAIGAGSAALIYSLRVPIIKAKNKLFNQSERTDVYNPGNVSTAAFLISFAATDLINFCFSNSKNKILNNSKINFSAGKSNYLNYSFNF